VVRLVDVMKTAQRRRMKPVQLDNYLLRYASERRRDSYKGSECDLTRLAHVASLNHSRLDWTQQAIPHCLGHHRQMHVEKRSAAFVDALPQVRIRLIGRAKHYCIRLGQRSVQRAAGRGTRHNPDPEFLPSGMLSLGALGNCFGYSFSRAGSGETAESDGLSIDNITRCFGSRERGDILHHGKTQISCK